MSVNFNTENFDALEILRINRRTLLHEPSGTYWSTSNDTQCVEVMTILISILQIFCSWAATSYLHPPMAFLSHNSSDTPGLAPFILRAVRLSNKLLGQGYVKERLRSSLRKFYGRYGDLIKQYEVPLSRMLHDILDADHLQRHPPLIRHYTNVLP